MIRTHSIHIPIPEGAPPTEFCLIHKGKNDSENGPYYFDDIAAKSVMQGYKRRGVDCMFDWAHQSLQENPIDARQAEKSAGWYKLKVRNGELWACDIKWTDEALDDFAHKRFRYFSPAFDADKHGRVLEYINCAVCNLPATHDNQALVAASRKLRNQKDNTPMTEEERKAFEETQKALEEMKKSHEEVQKRMTALEEKHAKLLKKMGQHEEEEEESDEEEEGQHEEEALPPPKDKPAPKGDDEPDGDEGDDDEEDEEERREGKHSVKSRAALNKEILRLSMENQKLRGVTTGSDLVTQINTAVRKVVITKAQMSWARSNPKAFRRLCAASKGTTQAYVPPVQEGSATRQLSSLEKETLAAQGIKEEDYTRSLQERPLGAPLKQSRFSK